MLSMEDSQNVPKNKFVIKVDSYLGLVEIYLSLVLGSEQSYQCNLMPIFIGNSIGNFNSVTSIHTNGIHFKYIQI